MTTPTHFASIENYDKGGVEIVGDDSPKRYLFSNMFEVAGRAAAWERVVVAKNLEFTVECTRAEGDSPWYIASHDETALAMQGEMEVHFVEPDNPALTPSADKQGAVQLEGEPAGANMGYVEMGRGHMALLPAGAAYQIRPALLGVVLFQSIDGDESVERWADICQH